MIGFTDGGIFHRRGAEVGEGRRVGVEKAGVVGLF